MREIPQTDYRGLETTRILRTHTMKRFISAQKLSAFSLLISSLLASHCYSASYSYAYGYQLGVSQSENNVSDGEWIEDADTSWDVSISNQVSSATREIITRGSLSDGSVRLYVDTTAGASQSGEDSFVSTHGAWYDFVTFNLADGISEAVIPISVSVDGIYEQSQYLYNDQAYINFTFGSLSLGERENIPDVFGSVYSGELYVKNEDILPVSMYYSLLINAFANQYGTANSLNSAVFNWTLPVGVSYESASGVFMTDLPSPVPLPAAAWLFGTGIMSLAGLASRKKNAGAFPLRHFQFSLEGKVLHQNSTVVHKERCKHQTQNR